MPYGQYLLGATLVLLVAEILAGRHRRIYRKEDVAVTILCQIVSIAATRPMAALLIATMIGLLLPVHRGALAGLPFWPAFLALVFITDLAFYWGHRLAHESMGTRHAWFWKLHRTHHAGKYMNVTVTARINPFWSFVVPTPWMLGVAIYLGLEQAAAATLVATYGWNLVTHSHFRWDDTLRLHPLTRRVMAVIEHVVVTPGIHHTHHGYGSDGKTYRNYAVMFSCIDWMFGTLHIPTGRPAKYGLPGDHPHWAEEAFYPLFRSRPMQGRIPTE